MPVPVRVTGGSSATADLNRMRQRQRRRSRSTGGLLVPRSRRARAGLDRERLPADRTGPDRAGRPAGQLLLHAPPQRYHRSSAAPHCLLNRQMYLLGPITSRVPKGHLIPVEDACDIGWGGARRRPGDATRGRRRRPPAPVSACGAMRAWRWMSSCTDAMSVPVGFDGAAEGDETNAGEAVLRRVGVKLETREVAWSSIPAIDRYLAWWRAAAR
jgi:hypothetical protein